MESKETIIERHHQKLQDPASGTKIKFKLEPSSEDQKIIITKAFIYLPKELRTEARSLGSNDISWNWEFDKKEKAFIITTFVANDESACDMTNILRSVGKKFGFSDEFLSAAQTKYFALVEEISSNNHQPPYKSSQSTTSFFHQQTSAKNKLVEPRITFKFKSSSEGPEIIAKAFIYLPEKLIDAAKSLNDISWNWEFDKKENAFIITTFVANDESACDMINILRSVGNKLNFAPELLLAAQNEYFALVEEISSNKASRCVIF